MMFLLLFTNLLIVDSSQIVLSFLPLKIKIINKDGSIILNSSQNIQNPVLIIKKEAEGTKEEAEKWFKKVKIEKLENKEEKEIEILIYFPKFQWNGLKNKKIKIILTLPSGIKLENLEAGIEDGEIQISDLWCKSYQVYGLNGAILLYEIKGMGKFKLQNGYIELKFSHDDSLDIKLSILNGCVSLSPSSYASIFPEITSGTIIGDYRKKDVPQEQKIRCEILNGLLIIK